ncbi:ABC transporter permease subunit [Corynebacterium ulceribovis]|uniref:ABC transporter permease subunit n=1 Tax=Corynebacterium ulceribovis TaxID=487732 RepID=UPI0003746661|nr:ABC transporter permease subunit [Corynebacterium ulceribovis]
MLLNSIRAEWLKLTTSKSFWWTSGIVLLLIVGLSWVMGWGQQQAFDSAVEQAKNPPEIPEGVDPATLPPEALAPTSVDPATFALEPSMVSLGFMFATMVFMIMAVMTVTNEYNSQMMKTTLAATPNRFVVLLTKVLVYGAFAVALAAVSYIAAFYVVQIPITTKELTANMSLTDGEFLRGLWANLLDVILTVIIGVGMGFLVRRTAGALSILLLWILVVESMIGLIPKIGSTLTEWMPFSLMGAWINNAGPEFDAMPWDNINYNPLYFGAICFAILIAGGIALYRRDA